MLKDNYRFCPRCKGELSILRGANFKCAECGFIIYNNSKPTASIMILDGRKVLMAIRADDPFKGEYDTVGGFLENGEDPVDCAKREAKEETGLDIEVLELLGTFTDTYIDDIYTLNLYYLAKIVGGELKAADDVATLEWLDLDNLPEMNGFKNTQFGLGLLKNWLGKHGSQ